MELQEKEEAIELMEEILDDRAVPKNIRQIIEEAKAKIKKETNSLNITTAIYMLDDICNDINMPSHTKTDLWQIISLLEAMNEKMK